MPYDTRVEDVLKTLRRALDTHRSAVVASADELRGALATHRGAGDDRGERLGLELGPFAHGRIDSGTLATVLAVGEKTLAPGSLEVLERALDVMVGAAGDLEDAAVVRVPPGGDLRDAVRDAYTATGVVFGAARAAELARSGTYRPDEHNRLFSGKPFHRWTGAERGVAPPLVVTVDGADLRPAGLADVLDGAVRIVLLVRGDAPPAALARVITPGVTVVQTRDPEELTLLAEAPGPALAALFEADAEGPVAFVHDPSAGDAPWERLRVGANLDELEKRLRTERWKDRTRAEDLAHLVAMARRPAPGAGPAGGAPFADGASGGPVQDGSAGSEDTGVDRLAAWLLATTELGA